MARRTRMPRLSRRERRGAGLVAVEDQRSPQEVRAWVTYGGPWALTLGSAVAAQATHMAVATDPTACSLTALALAGAGAGLSKWVNHLDKAAKRGADTQRLHTINITAVTAGLTLGTIVGVDDALTAGTWAIGGAALSTANNLWSKLHRKEREATGGKWARLEQEIGLARHELKNVSSNGKGTVLAEVEGRDGATGEELARAIPSLASALKVGKGRITQVVNEDDASRSTLRVQVADLLKEGIPWRGPSALGASIGDVPIRIGRYEDGEDLLLNVTGQLRDPQGLSIGNVEHCIAMGVNGAGKTQGNCLLITEAATRTEVSVIVVDCAKFQQDFGHVRHGIDWPIEDPAEARRFFKVLPAAIRARTDYLASKGLSYWTPGCGLNFLMIIGEEAADYAADNEHYQKILRTARAAGIWVLTSLQRATHNNMDTDSRANSPSGLCYGLRDGSDAQYCLPDEAIEAGAWPQWGNRKPGYLYVAGLGTPEDRWHVIARTERVDKRGLADAITAAASIRTPLDEVTARAFGDLYSSRTTYTTPLLEGGHGTTGTSTPAPAAPVTPTVPAQASPPATEIEEEVEVDEETLAREVEDMMDAIEDLLRQQPEPGEYDHLRLEDEVPAPDADSPTLELRRNEEQARLSTQEAQQAIYRRLDEWIRAGRAEFRPSDLADIWSQVNLADPRRWFYRLLNKLKNSGVVSDDDGGQGEWDILRSPLADDAE